MPALRQARLSQRREIGEMSALIVCLICDRQRKVFDTYGINICSNCGVRDPRIVRDHRQVEDWSNKDGISNIEAQRRAYARLKWLRDTKRHKQGFALAKFKDIFGYWPPREIEDVPPEAPTAGLLRRINHDNLLWKKQKRAEEQVAKDFVQAVDTRIAAGQPSFMSADD